MELRDIEIFLALAEELHVGRTADRLQLSAEQVRLSIAEQERRVGASLFEPANGRDDPRVALTPIGRHLYADLDAGYRRIQDGFATAAASARGHTGTLALGITSTLGQELAPITRLFRARHPGCELQIREVHHSDPFGPLRAGDVDIQLSPLPVDEPDIICLPVDESPERGWGLAWRATGETSVHRAFAQAALDARAERG
ncbi:DNA-binding transcriptional LysR family regulator [Allocatelliglobosispora scoriae]|uniref:DNA-binding transcriptional LysR family regulator n=1 Tax=Allocatelliglobosispora scoriae TaxID=643052 RepID=A0A841C1P2_9ACTN|nr:LysR substrate-binding domain-containing protein [Allocatelliglobosispora scoriae]MBB5872890.1 DNA-binding transcriptional LysR family regulator [Allocatelliglobosispora scoriae]